MDSGLVLPNSEVIIAFGLSTVRASVALGTLPFGQRSSVGKKFTWPMALAVALCVPHPSLELRSDISIIALGLKEALIGWCLGHFMSRIFYAVSAAGAVLDQQAGYTMGGSLNPNFGIATGPLETIFSTLLVLMLLLDGSVQVAFRALLATYEAWPIGELYPGSGVSFTSFFSRNMDAQFQLIMDVALGLAAPLIALLLLVDICVAVASRYAQQINPFSMSLAIKAMATSFLLVMVAFRQWKAWSWYFGPLMR
ncbi:EscT/YscT/HrcT family type III secretion system export apparatus protein [Dyella sp.]|uniref:EscT/YscT/HrcT family type III secretion system export apparatus protein n=1 Tax=Dyella sp. TaxID=1869338 RepID=UPI002ED014E8